MYAIIELGGHQYKVAEGDVIEADRMAGEESKSLTLDKVLLFADGNSVQVGQPYLKDVKVTAKVVAHTKADKVVDFKFRKRKGVAKRHGQRHKLTALNITKIAAK